jgi:hypothetical protein
VKGVWIGVSGPGGGYAASGRGRLHYRGQLGSGRGAPSSRPDQPPTVKRNSACHCFRKGPVYRLLLAATLFPPAFVILGALA